MSRKISHSLVSGRAGAGTGGQGLKIGSKGRLYWKDVNESSLQPWYGDRGVFNGSNDSGAAQIDYINVTSPGNAADFGDLSVSRTLKSIGGASSGSRGVFAGGNASGASNVMDYITFSTLGCWFC